MFDDRTPFGGVGRLTGTGDADGHAEPSRRESNAPLGQLDALAGPDIGPADVAAADLDAMTSQMVAKRRGFGVVAFSVITADSGITRPPKLWPRKASSRWSMPASRIRSTAVQTPDGP